jgi:adenine-specific DNA-methyltransferase
MPDQIPVTRFEYPDAKRKHIPPSGEMATKKVREEAKAKFAYDPHRTPTLRFNEQIARCRELLEKSTRVSLQRDEAAELAQFLESEQPWLEWAGKREQTHFEVDPVALHIHERVSARAILNTVRREDIQRDFFAEPHLPAREARAYYQYDVEWANRIILGDSLQVMTSLARREGLAGQVQMIYLDPPYGIKFSSNWQNEVGKRDVKDKDEDLTREPEMIRAYRDTWTLGVHSYLAYLKQRLLLGRELLTDSGSIFVQISDENLHRVRAIMDEVFGAGNFCSTIHFKSTTGQTSELVSQVGDYLLWYCKNRELVRYNPLFVAKTTDDPTATNKYAELQTGERRALQKEERDDFVKGYGRLFALDNITSQSGGDNSRFAVPHEGQSFRPDPGFWKTNAEGVRRLADAERLGISGRTLRYVRFSNDFPVSPIASLWTDTSTGSFTEQKVYVVQTNLKIVQRCLLMTTKPGELVLDPTCGSGTTAFVAEQWGRRWITIDSSRVAAAIARQRLLTATFETYKTRNPDAGVDPTQPLNPKHGFYYKAVPHITLKSIAQNKGLDPIFARHEAILAEQLAALNAALGAATETLRRQLVGKLISKLRDDGARTLTDADKRRWLFPGTDPQLIQQQKGGPTATQARDLRAAIPKEASWHEWEVPFDTDPEWPKSLQDALTAYRTAWREKMDEVNDAIAKNADPQEIVDQPEVLRGIVRVSGPFTVESIRPPENSPERETADSSPIAGAPDELPTFEGNEVAATNAANHIDRMLSLLRQDGITFLGNRHVKLDPLERIESSFLHAAGEYTDEKGKRVTVAVAIGPEIGSVPVFQVEETMRLAYRKGYDLLVIAAFSFDAAAQEAIQSNNDDPNSKLRIEMAQIRPDVTMGDLLKKTQVTAQIFTVFGQPRSTLTESKDGTCTVIVEGVDIYDPVKNSIEATSASKVAAWFLDTDYDGKVFCICQAFFPDKSAWEKLNRALKGSIEEGAFEALSGTTSIPFKPGEWKTVAVKVIDPRGNEVMRVHRIGRESYA